MIKRIFFIVFVVLIGYPIFSQSNKEIIETYLELKSENKNSACFLTIDDDSNFYDSTDIEYIVIQEKDCSHEMMEDAEILSLKSDAYLIDDTVILKDISSGICLFIPVEDILTVFLYFDEDEDYKGFVDSLDNKYQG